MKLSKAFIILTNFRIAEQQDFKVQWNVMRTFLVDQHIDETEDI